LLDMPAARRNQLSGLLSQLLSRLDAEAEGLPY